jgi:hypothetical protein
MYLEYASALLKDRPQMFTIPIDPASFLVVVSDQLPSWNGSVESKMPLDVPAGVEENETGFPFMCKNAVFDDTQTKTKCILVLTGAAEATEIH